MWRRIMRDWDWTIVLCTVLLVAVGVTVIGSATHVNKDGLQLTDLVSKQLLFFGINAVIVVVMQFFDYRRLRSWGRPLYIVTLLIPRCEMISPMFFPSASCGFSKLGFPFESYPISWICNPGKPAFFTSSRK